LNFKFKMYGETVMRLVTLGCVLCFLSACATGPAFMGDAYRTHVDNFKIPTSSAVFFGLHAESDEGSYLAGSQALSRALTLGNEDDDKAIQSAVMAELMAVSDMSCSNYLAEIIATDNEIRSFLGILDLSLTTFAPLVKPKSTQDALTGLAALSTGTESELSATLLDSRDVPLIYQAVRTARKKDRARILKLADDSESMAVPFAELAYYHERCGVTDGIVALRDAVEKSNENAQEAGRLEAAKTLEAGG
ncbi:MAG: hypothetical protein AAFR74_08790, partial [Pseudomonadota bacterium]